MWLKDLSQLRQSKSPKRGITYSEKYNCYCSSIENDIHVHVHVHVHVSG